jgi:hypothetical protein
VRCPSRFWYAVLLVYVAERILTAGANRSRHAPKLERLSLASELFVAPAAARGEHAAEVLPAPIDPAPARASSWRFPDIPVGSRAGAAIPRA